MTAQQLHGVIRRILGSTTWFGRPVWQWILVTGLIVRVAYLAAAWTCSPVERWWICSDTSGFTAAAESLMNGTYSCRPGDDRFRYNRPPGYPAVLALTSMLTGTQPESTSILFVQAVMGALWCAMMYDLTRRLNLRNEIATIVGLAAVFHPTSVSAGALSLSDASALFFVTAGLWFLATGKQKTSFYLLIAGSLCIGFAVITRSAYQAFILACPLVIWLWPEGKRPGYALLTASFLAAAALPAAWMTFMYNQVGFAALSTNNSTTLYTNLGTGLRVSGEPRSHTVLAHQALARRNRVMNDTWTETDRMRWEKAQAESLITANIQNLPLYLLRTYGHVLAGPPQTHFAHFPPSSNNRSSAPVRLFSATYTVLVAAGLLLIASRRQWHHAGLFVVILVAALGPVAIAGAKVGSRLLLPAAFPLILSAAVTLWWMLAKTMRRNVATFFVERIAPDG